MQRLFLALTLTLAAACGAPATDGPASAADIARWERRAQDVTIIRDTWGIPHIYGTTDADAVFGMIYAQAEDDFNRIEVNFLNGMGRLAEAEGESEIYRDLRMKLFIDPVDMKQQYAGSPEWLRALMDAWADGLNYFLHTHPEVKPRVLTHFEPWMALTFSEGSIGGDIERVSLADLETFYGRAPAAAAAAAAVVDRDDEPRGSNGFAIAGSNTASGDAMLYINPHTSFFFRSELQMASEEGLNAYGAVTWGQFFIYQGFNERTGWMHTSSRADTIDEYLETIVQKEDGPYYTYGDEERKLRATTLTVPYKDGEGMSEREFTVYHSHHGPIIREQDGKWVAIRLMQEPVKALTQSYTRTKAMNHDEFRASMDIRTNSSNNTVYADADGNIVYYHGNFMPRRDTQFDWSNPVDGSTPATEWQDLHPVDEMIVVMNPPNGWIQNTNNWPFSAAGEHSPKQADYPTYMAPDTENARGIHAIRVFDGKTGFTVDSLIAAGYDSYLTAFEPLIPALLTAYDGLPASDPAKAGLRDQIELLRGWDLRFSEESTATSLATLWGNELTDRVRPDWRKAADGGDAITLDAYLATRTTPTQRLDALAAVSERLTADFGSWQTPWGEINRYQRLTGDIVQTFDDNAPSVPVGFHSGRWGSLASFGSRTYPGTKRMYGTSGNSFIAAVEFGDRLRAKAITAGGLSSDAASPHFGDQAEMYAKGQFRDVLFYREDVEQHVERQYHPGERAGS